MSAVSVSLQPDTLPFSLIKPHRCTGTCEGHTFKVIYESVADIALGVLDGARRVIRAIGQIRMDTNCFCRAIKLGIHVFSSIELTLGRPGIFSTVSQRLLTTEDIIDTFQIFDQSHYFIGKEHKKGKLQENIWNIIANSALLAAGVGGLVFLGGEMVLKGLSKVSASIGGHSAFGMASKACTVVGKVVGGLVGVGFAFLGADAIRRIVQTSKEITNSKTEREKTKFVQNKRRAILDLAWCVTEVALKVITVALCITNPWVLVAAGSVSALLGCIAFLYGKSVEDRQKEAEKVMPSGLAGIALT